MIYNFFENNKNCDILTIFLFGIAVFLVGVVFGAFFTFLTLI